MYKYTFNPIEGNNGNGAVGQKNLTPILLPVHVHVVNCIPEFYLHVHFVYVQ